MKFKTTLLASLLAIFAGTTLTVYAADEKPAAEKPAAEKSGDAKSEKEQPKKKVKKHSHVEEKTGSPQAEPEAKSDKADISKDKSKHFHPRDGK